MAPAESKVEPLRCVPRLLVGRNALLREPLSTGDLADVAEEVLRRLLAEGVDLSDRRRLAARADELCRIELVAELRRDGHAPDGPGTAPHPDLESFVREALAAGPAPFEDEVLAHVEVPPAAPSPGEAPADGTDQPRELGWRAPLGPMLSWWWIAGAIAAVGLALVAPILFPPSGDPAEDAGALVAPVGPVSSFEEFSWNPVVGGAREYRLRIWIGDEAVGPADHEEAVAGRTRFAPGAQLRARLEGAPGTVVWEVVDRGQLFADELALGRARATLSDSPPGSGSAR